MQVSWAFDLPSKSTGTWTAVIHSFLVSLFETYLPTEFKGTKTGPPLSLSRCMEIVNYSCLTDAKLERINRSFAGEIRLSPFFAPYAWLVISVAIKRIETGCGSFLLYWVFLFSLFFIYFIYNSLSMLAVGDRSG